METQANLDASVDCCVLQVLREGSMFEGKRRPDTHTANTAIQLNPNKSCAIACCHDNGGPSEKEGGRLAVFSAEALKSGGHIVFVARTEHRKQVK